MTCEVIQKLSCYGELRIDGNRIRVCIPSKSREDRLAVLNTINQDFQDFCCFIMNDKPSYSSIGYVQIKHYKVSVKSSRQQNKLSPGVPNENVLINEINKYIKDSNGINLIFLNSKIKLSYSNIIKCYATGNRKLRKRRTKADMVIETLQDKYNVSIKQHDAERWESADTSHGLLAFQKLQQAIDQQKTKLLPFLDSDQKSIVRSDGKSVMRLENEIYWHMTADEQAKTIFGDDIVDGGAVVFNTFTPDHFEYDNTTNTLTVKCDRIYTVDTPIDAKDRPCWIVRNDVTRNCKKLGIPGLRIESVFESRIKYGVEV